MGMSSVGDYGQCTDGDALRARAGCERDRSAKQGAMEQAKTQLSAEALQHLDALYNLARWLVRDPAEAEDLVQETYLKALRAAHQFRPGTNLRAWLLQIMRNTFYTQYKRQGRAPTATEPETLERLAHDSGYGASGDGDGRATIGLDLTAALQQLPEEYRSVVLLADLEDCTMEEIATIMACPVGTVKSRLFRARGLLKGLLRDYAR
jgi:RNA polymerase sigma-70 factor (ECF subfamily)